MENVKAYLYDARGPDDEVSIDEFEVGSLKDNQLLWVNVLRRDAGLLQSVAARLGIENVPVRTVIDDSHRLNIDKFKDFFRFCVDSVQILEDHSPKRVKVDYLLGKNYVVTIHDGDITYFQEFRDREKDETPMGRLTAESFVSTLLDLNVVSYFRAVDEIENRVDELDELILKRDFDTARFLKVMVTLRHDVSLLRRWLVPHREVFYALSRADFQQIAESDSQRDYEMLNQHFEQAVDAIENARESVVSVFELYATKSAQMTNTFVQRLTFLTLLTGSLAVIAGIMGMNFKASIFEIENGFWFTVAGLVTVAGGLTAFAFLKKWI